MKKHILHIISIFLTFTILIGSFSLTKMTVYAAGSGAPFDPILIYNADDLKQAITHPGSCFKLMSDITGVTFMLGDAKYSNGSRFGGHFDGNGHTISINITINPSKDRETNDYYSFGLFPYIEPEAVVENLTVTGSLTDNEKGNSDGGLAGWCEGTILNCSSAVTVTGSDSSEIGGLVGDIGGWSYGTVKNSCATGKVSGGEFSRVGGIAGSVSASDRHGRTPSSIINCYVTGDISGVGSIGHLFGSFDANPDLIIVTNCHWNKDANLSLGEQSIKQAIYTDGGLEGESILGSASVTDSLNSVAASNSDFAPWVLDSSTAYPSLSIFPPTGVTHTNPSANGDDGTISGVNSTMEYKLSASSSYISIADGKTSITGLGNGTYYVRHKANGAFSASVDVTVNLVKPRHNINTATSSITLDDFFIEGQGGVTFDKNTKLIAQESNKVIPAANGQQGVKLFDISLMLNGSKIEPNGKVKVTIKLPSECSNYKNLGVVYLDDNNAVHPIQSTVNGNTISFIAEHFSLYGIVGTPAGTNQASSVSLKSPETSDKKPVLPIALLMVASVGILICSRKRFIHSK